MIAFTKRFGAYVAAAVSCLVALKTLVGVSLDWHLLILVGGIACLLCALVAWLETYRQSADSTPTQAASADEGSLSIAVKRGLTLTRFANRDDESVALRANKMVRKRLDKGCISYREYREWRRKNPLIFTSVVGSNDQLIGFFDVFPLTSESACGLLNGTLSEKQLNKNSILPSTANPDTKFVYVASVMVNPNQTLLSCAVAKEVLLLRLAEFLITEFPPSKDRILFAYAHTPAGERLLRNADFRNTALPTETRQHDPLYQLSAEGYEQLAASIRLFVHNHRRRPRGGRSRGPVKQDHNLATS